MHRAVLDSLRYHLAKFRLHGQMSQGNLTFIPTHCLFGDVNSKLVSHDPALASICQNLSNDRFTTASSPRGFESSAQSRQHLQPVENDRELFTSPFTVFSCVDSDAVFWLQKRNLGSILFF